MVSEIESFIIRMTGIEDWVIEDYFKGVKYRGMYLMEVKSQCIEILLKKGYTYDKVAEIISAKDHVSVAHHRNKRKKDPKIVKIVKSNFEDWVTLRKYPVIEGRKIDSTYKLVDKSEVNNIKN